ncbi:MAG: hypothetical protein M1420_05660 [Actinobacteria bacterium]|nr:hypothetical protein [Actinomycetota bacterium]
MRTPHWLGSAPAGHLSRDAVEQRLAHHVALAETSAPSIKVKRVTMHTLRHVAAMRLFSQETSSQ